MFHGISPLELLLLVFLFVLIFGPKKLPDLGAGLGKAITNFKKAYHDGTAIDVTPTEQIEDKRSSEGAARTTTPEQATVQRTE